MTDPRKPPAVTPRLASRVHPQQATATGFTAGDRTTLAARPGSYSQHITRPEIRRVLQEYGIDPRREETPAVRHAQPPGRPDDEDAIVRVIEDVLARERESRMHGARDSIADAERSATDASALGVQTIEATVAQAKRWAKFMVPIAAILMTAMAGCGAGIAGYVGQSKGTTDATKAVVEEAAKETAKKVVEETPIAKPEKVFVYVPVPAPTAPLPASFEGGL